MSNTLKQFVGCCHCLTILWGWRLKGQNNFHIVHSILIPDLENVLPESSGDDLCCDAGTVLLNIYS